MRYTWFEGTGISSVISENNTRVSQVVIYIAYEVGVDKLALRQHSRENIHKNKEHCLKLALIFLSNIFKHLVLLHYIKAKDFPEPSGRI